MGELLTKGLENESTEGRSERGPLEEQRVNWKKDWQERGQTESDERGNERGDPVSRESKPDEDETRRDT